MCLICDISECNCVFEEPSIAELSEFLDGSFTIRAFADEVGLRWKVVFEHASKDFSSTGGPIIYEDECFAKNEMSVSFLSFFLLRGMFTFYRQKSLRLRDEGIEHLQDFIKDPSAITSEIKDVKPTI